MIRHLSVKKNHLNICGVLLFGNISSSHVTFLETLAGGIARSFHSHFNSGKCCKNEGTNVNIGYEKCSQTRGSAHCEAVWALKKY